MASSIELINPKAESVRRAAALQVRGGSDPVAIRVLRLRDLGQYHWCDGPRECGQEQSRCVAG